MADKTKIEWSEATWNPVVGCTHVSPGCDNCYAAREASGRLSATPTYAGLARAGKFTGEVRLLPERLDQPLRWRKPRRVFVNSMSDLFHDGIPDEFIADVFAVMALAPQHTYQVLTKRHGRLRSLLDKPSFPGMVENRVYKRHRYAARLTWPIPQVWLGVSVESQQWADIRVPALLDTPAAVRWLSCEPLLGPVSLARPDGQVNERLRGGRCGSSDGFCGDNTCRNGIDWVVVGGESGPGARPMHPDWARSLRDQCVSAGVPYFFKQWGEWSPNQPDTWVGHESRNGWHHNPNRHAVVDAASGAAKPVGEIDGTEAPYAFMYRVGKKSAGRLLDGRTWDEYPEAGDEG